MEKGLQLKNIQLLQLQLYLCYGTTKEYYFVIFATIFVSSAELFQLSSGQLLRLRSQFQWKIRNDYCYWISGEQIIIFV